MNKTKPITPYQRLLTAVRQYIVQVNYPHTVLTYYFSKKGIDNNSGYSLQGLRERIIAARDLGYEIKLREKDGDIKVYYVKIPADIDYYVG